MTLRVVVAEFAKTWDIVDEHGNILGTAYTEEIANALVDAFNAFGEDEDTGT